MVDEGGLSFIEQSIDWATYVVDIGGSAVMLIGFLIAFAAFVNMQLKRAEPYRNIQRIRCMLGSYLALGLELMIVSDVLHTLVSPSLDSLAFLGGLVAIRTLIAFFLGREIAEMHEGVAAAPKAS